MKFKLEANLEKVGEGGKIQNTREQAYGNILFKDKKFFISIQIRFFNFFSNFEGGIICCLHDRVGIKMFYFTGKRGKTKLLLKNLPFRRPGICLSPDPC